MIKAIESADNQWVKLAASLHHKKYRENTRLFLLEGIHLIQECLNTDWSIEAALCVSERSQSPEMENIMVALQLKEIPFFEINESLLRKVAETQSPQGIIAIVNQKEQPLPIEKADAASVWVVLDQVQDPGNVGTIIRTAAAAGCSGVFLTEGSADLYAGKTVRASMGALFHIPCFQVSASEVMAFCRNQNMKMFIADGSSSLSYTQTDISRDCLFVFGNEGAGVSAPYVNSLAEKIKIPITGRTESLNVSAAAAVILFESARQRALSL